MITVLHTINPILTDQKCRPGDTALRHHHCEYHIAFCEIKKSSGTKMHYNLEILASKDPPNIYSHPSKLCNVISNWMEEFFEQK